VSLGREFVGFEIDGDYMREAVENVQRAGAAGSQLRLFEGETMGDRNTGTHLMHVAIRARDPVATRRFYEEGLGMRFVGLRPSGVGAFDLADGATNLTIIPYEGPDRPALEEGTEQIHFGFLVEDATATFRKLQSMGFAMLKENVKTRDPVKEPEPRGSFKVADPDGNVIDVTGNPQEWRV
jgi:catechol 2,3-dioxygenase-like lactoylglutathione lyase family enzyme